MGLRGRPGGGARWLPKEVCCPPRVSPRAQCEAAGVPLACPSSRLPSASHMALAPRAPSPHLLLLWSLLEPHWRRELHVHGHCAGRTPAQPESVRGQQPVDGEGHEQEQERKRARPRGQQEHAPPVPPRHLTPLGAAHCAQRHASSPEAAPTWISFRPSQSDLLPGAARPWEPAMVRPLSLNAFPFRLFMTSQPGARSVPQKQN